MPFNPSKVIDRVKPPALIVQESIIIRGSKLIELTTPYKDSVLTRSLINTEEARSANAALLSELRAGGQLSTRGQLYAECIVRRSERVQVRNTIIEEDHAKLKEAMARRKAIQSGKRAIVDGKHILTTPEVHDPLVESP